MLNISLLSFFSTVHSDSPLITTSFSSSNIVVKNFRIYSSFNSLLWVSSLSNLKISDCSYFHFLSSPIYQSTLENQVYHETLTLNDEKVIITNCKFFDCKSQNPGAAIHINNKMTDLVVENSIFHNCRCEGKGGAIYAIMNHFVCKQNFFHLCRCGKKDGNDGSTVYAYSNIGINTSFISANECPRHGEMCWYGILILCNGVLKSENINVSNSDVEYISGLAHFRPAKDQSYLLFYTSINQIHGNALAFIDFSFDGYHSYGSLVNDSTTSGIFYVQNSTTKLQNYYFINNKGPITYACVGKSLGNFENCFFDTKYGENLGIGFGTAINCKWGQKNIPTLNMKQLKNIYDLNNGNINHIINVQSYKNLKIMKISKILIVFIIIFVIYKYNIKIRNSWRSLKHKM